PAPLSASSSIARRVGAPGNPRRARSADSQPWCCSPAVSSAAAETPSAVSVIGFRFISRDHRLSSAILPGSRVGRGCVRVRNTDCLQNLSLKMLHRFCLGLGLMVPAQEMQEAVDNE